MYSVSNSASVSPIGTKFPPKTLEVMLKATVYFSKYEVTPGSRFDEQFCVGLNSYAQVIYLNVLREQLAGNWYLAMDMRSSFLK